MNNSDSEGSTCSGKSFKKNTMSSSLYRLSRLKNVGGQLEKPAELFRKDLISAMKMADSESLLPEEYILISDPWRQDWEKGVQVPVNPKAEKTCQVNVIKENEFMNGPYGFKLPKKLLHAVADENYRQSYHELHETHKLQEEVCRYDMDCLDEVWLRSYNSIRDQCGQDELAGWVMEQIIEELETRCYGSLKAAEAEGMEYDEDTVCDVCRMPDVEEGNEMVFCDGCDVGVHQACYGILSIPKGSWVCRTCAIGIKPRCALCTTVGGAMKSTKDGSKWAHLSCAIWIPEVVIEDPEKMEPVCNIDLIPTTRWNLICCVCKERSGVCVQCCEKKCKTAFHVTCAFKKNFEMKMNCEDNELQFKGFCDEHSKNKSESTLGSPSRKTSEEQKTNEKSRLQSLREEFYLYVKQEDIANDLDIDNETLTFVYEYWKLKRKSNFDKPLMTPKTEESILLMKQREDSLGARLRMFIHLRQDLERVRNLCYMVLKRERTRLQLQAAKKELFFKQVEVLDMDKLKPGSKEYEMFRKIHKQNLSIYDNPKDIDRAAKHYEGILAMESKEESDFDAVDDVGTSDCAANIPTPSGDTLCKTPKPKVKGNMMTPSPASRGRPPSSAKGKKRTASSEYSNENPYARPTYKNFSWILGSRKKRKRTGSTNGETENHKLTASASDPLCNLSPKEDPEHVIISTKSLTDLGSMEEAKPEVTDVAVHPTKLKPFETPSQGTPSAESSPKLIRDTTSPLFNLSSNADLKTPLLNVVEHCEVIPKSLTEAEKKSGKKTPDNSSVMPENDIAVQSGIKPKRKPRKTASDAGMAGQKLRKRKRLEDVEIDEIPQSEVAMDSDPISTALLSPPQSSSPDNNVEDLLKESRDLWPLTNNHKQNNGGFLTPEVDTKNVLRPPDVSNHLLSNAKDDQSTSHDVCKNTLFSPPKKIKKNKSADIFCKVTTVNGDASTMPKDPPKSSSRRSSRQKSGGEVLSMKKGKHLGNSKDSGPIQSKMNLSPLFSSKSLVLNSPNNQNAPQVQSSQYAEKKADSSLSKFINTGNPLEGDDDINDFVDPPKFKQSPRDREHPKSGRQSGTKKFGKVFDKDVTPIIKSFQATLDNYIRSKDGNKAKVASSPEKNSEMLDRLSSSPSAIARENGVVMDPTMKRVVLKLDRITSSMEKVSPQKFLCPPDKKTLKSSSNLPRRKVIEPEKKEEFKQKYVTRNSLNGRN